MTEQVPIRLKTVVVLDEALPVGVAVNTATVLALTLGSRLSGIVGPDLYDGAGDCHAGITTVPIPILKASADHLRELRLRASAGDADVLVVDFTDAAQTTHTYADYEASLKAADLRTLTYLGLALHGAQKQINKLTGGLPLLR